MLIVYLRMLFFAFLIVTVNPLIAQESKLKDKSTSAKIKKEKSPEQIVKIFQAEWNNIWKKIKSKNNSEATRVNKIVESGQLAQAQLEIGSGIKKMAIDRGWTKIYGNEKSIKDQKKYWCVIFDTKLSGGATGCLDESEKLIVLWATPEG